MGSIAGERSPHLIPIQEIERDDRRDQECGNHDAGPKREPAPGEAEIPEVGGNLIMPEGAQSRPINVRNQ